MKRRDFVRNMALVSAGTPILLNKIKIQSIGKELFSVPKSAEDRVLVIIRLNGGNDGLSTIIPRDQYANLTIQRSNVLIPESSVLPLTTEVGMHPVMTGMQGLYQDGKLGIIQNVGYAEQNRSHFRSMDIWSSGLIDAQPTTGWIGRAFDQLYPNYPDAYPNAQYPDPFAISMGYSVSSTCQGLMANFSHAVVDPSTNFNLLTSNSTNDGTYYGEHIEYISTLIDQANAYGQQINDAAAAGGSNIALYDQNNPLAVQMHHVANMISGGLQSKIYVLNVNGFDTHDSQVSVASTEEGVHADLLQKLSDAVASFQADLNALGLEERVMGMTFSEFGRQIASNASLGTDHGDAAPLMMFGTCLDFSIIGDNPVIGNTIVNQAGIPMQYDFRDVYASVLKDWFQIPAADIQALFEHSVTFYSLMSACNVGIDEIEITKEQALIYPNPCYTNATIKFKSTAEWVKIDVLDMQGKLVVNVLDGNVNSGMHDVFMPISHLKMGQYLVKIQKDSGNVQCNLVKVQ